MSQRYAWLGATRKRAVRDIASSCFDAWLRDWCLQHEASETSFEETSLISLPHDEYATWAVEAGDGHLLAALPRGRIDDFGGRLASADAGSSDGVAAELASFAMRDLLVRLAARARHLRASPITWKDAWPGTILEPVWGGLGLRISFDGFDLVLGMDRAVIDLMCPERVRVTDELPGRSESLAQLPVMLSAVLDFGSVNASDIADLRVGEVLMSERTIGDPVALRAGDRHVFNASLARAGSQFAIIAAALPTGQNR